MKAKMGSGNRSFASVLGALFLCLLIPGVFAQEVQDLSPPEPAAVTDTELEQFAAVMLNVQEINLQTQTGIEGIIEGSDLSRERFIEIYEAGQSLGAGQPADITETEQAEFSSIMQEIMTLQTAAEESMFQAVSDSGLTIGRFEEIYTSIQNDPSVLERLQPLIDEGQPEEQPPEGGIDPATID